MDGYGYSKKASGYYTPSSSSSSSSKYYSSTAATASSGMKPSRGYGSSKPVIKQGGQTHDDTTRTNSGYWN